MLPNLDRYRPPSLPRWLKPLTTEVARHLLIPVAYAPVIIAFPRPARGRGPQGGPGPARPRSSIATGACITPGLHSNTAGSAPDCPRGAAAQADAPPPTCGAPGIAESRGRTMQPAGPGYLVVSGAGRPAGPKAPRSKPGAWGTGCVQLFIGTPPVDSWKGAGLYGVSWSVKPPGHGTSGE